MNIRITRAPRGLHSGGRRGFPSVADCFLLLGIFLAANLVGALTAWCAGLPMPDPAAVAAAQGAERLALERGLALFNAVSYTVAMGLTTVVSLLYRRRRGGTVPLRLSRRGFDVGLLLWGLLLMTALAVVVEPLLLSLPEIPDVYGRGVWAFVTLVVAAPLLEELLFRGILLESARRRYGDTIAWLLSSLLFAVVHLHPTVAVNALFMGLVLGLVYLLTESLWGSVLLHAVNNLIAYLTLAFGGDTRSLLEAVSSPLLRGTIYGATVALALLSAWRMYALWLRRGEPADGTLPTAATEENSPRV